MNSKIVFFFMIMCCCSVTLFAQTNTGKKQTSTNPVFAGWYADPEGVVFVVSVLNFLIGHLTGYYLYIL